MKLKKFTQIKEEKRFGFDDIDQPFEKNDTKDLSWLDEEPEEDDEAKLAAKTDLKSDVGFKKLNIDDSGYTSYDYYEEDDPYSSDTYSSTTTSSSGSKKKEKV